MRKYVVKHFHVSKLGLYLDSYFKPIIDSLLLFKIPLFKIFYTLFCFVSIQTLIKSVKSQDYSHKLRN